MVETEESDSSPRKQADFEPEGPASSGERAALANSDFLARMSHEMRTPLSAILGYAQLMGSGAHAATGAQKRSLELILQAGWYLEKLIETTRDLALIESGTLALSLDRLSLAAIMRDCEGMIDSEARTRSVRVIFPEFDTPCFVSVDGIRVQQVLGNLLSAAIERSAVGGVVIVDCATDGAQWVRISISDGVAQEVTAAQDLGICGLLASRLVELMGGTTGADGAVGPGRASWFTLKRVDAPMAASHAASRSHIPLTGSDTSVANAIPG